MEFNGHAYEAQTMKIGNCETPSQGVSIELTEANLMCVRAALPNISLHTQPCSRNKLSSIKGCNWMTSRGVFRLHIVDGWHTKVITLHLKS